MPVNFSQKILFFTLDVIRKVALGTAFGMLRVDADIDEYLLSCEEGLRINNRLVALVFNWLGRTPFVGKLLAPSPKENKGFGKMISTAYRLVDERAASPFDKRSDIFVSFMRHGLHSDELRSEAVEQIFAGSETTASAIRIALLPHRPGTRSWYTCNRVGEPTVELRWR